MFSNCILALFLFNISASVFGAGDEIPNPGFFLTAAKSVPRIGKRQNKGNSDFEQFFLKASKSVPRIGRDYENILTSEILPPSALKAFRYPTWSEIADRYEYQPELFTSPENLYELEQLMGDDPSVYQWDKFRFKRSVPLVPVRVPVSPRFHKVSGNDGKTEIHMM